jgi:hypothetical protein
MLRNMTRFALILGVFTAACGDADSSDRAAEPDTTAAASSPAADADSVKLGLPAPRDTSRPPGSVGTLADSEIVLATIAEGRIQLSRDTVPAGEVTVVVDNRGSAPCALEVRSHFAGRSRSAPVRPGGNMSMTMVLSTAPYQLYCADVAGSERAARDTVRLMVR